MAPARGAGLVLVAGGVIVTQFLRRRSTTTATSTRSAHARVRGRPPAAGPGHRRQGHGRDGDGVTLRHRFNGKTLPVRYEGQPGGSSRSASPSSCTASSSPARSRATGSRSSTPTSTWRRTADRLDRTAARGVRRVLAASLNGALGRAGLMLALASRAFGALATGLRHPPRRPRGRAQAPRVRVAVRRRRRVLAIVIDAAGADHPRLLAGLHPAGRVARRRRRSTTSPRCGRRWRARSCCGW